MRAISGGELFQSNVSCYWYVRQNPESLQRVVSALYAVCCAPTAPDVGCPTTDARNATDAAADAPHPNGSAQQRPTEAPTPTAVLTTTSAHRNVHIGADVTCAKVECDSGSSDCAPAPVHNVRRVRTKKTVHAKAPVAATQQLVTSNVRDVIDPNRSVHVYVIRPVARNRTISCVGVKMKHKQILLMQF